MNSPSRRRSIFGVLNEPTELPSGRFRVDDGRCIGWVIDKRTRQQPLTVELRRGNRVLFSLTPKRIDGEIRRTFVFPLDSLKVHGAEILREDVKLYVIQSDGVEAKMSLDGLSALSLIKQFLPREKVTICDYGFGRDGNGLHLLSEGWHKPESKSTWTSDKKAIMNLPFRPAQHTDYELNIVCHTFLKDRANSKQTVMIFIDGIQIVDSIIDLKFHGNLIGKFSGNTIFQKEDQISNLEFYCPSSDKSEFIGIAISKLSLSMLKTIV